MAVSKEQIAELLSRGVDEVIDREHLAARLAKGEKLRVKLGIDPTSPDLHLGRSVPLLKLRDFQEMGHSVILLVGNATGVVGDTSDKESERPMLSEGDIEKNMNTYTEQAAKILDMKKVEVVFNAEWLNELGYAEIGEHADQFSLHEFIARENIKKRLDGGKRVSLREVLYPLMQGYDSVAVHADVELGGTDQRFNLLAGRTLQEHFGQTPQDVVMTNLIIGTDGRKMSSSWGNTVNLTDSARDMFGKVMSMPDTVMEEYFVHCTRVPLADVAKTVAGDQRDAKIRLAKEIVTIYHSADAATEEENYFVQTFSQKKAPANMPTHDMKDAMALIDVLHNAGLADSRSDARRKIEQGGVSVDDEKVTNTDMWIRKVNDGSVIKVGKRNFCKITFSL